MKKATNDFRQYLVNNHLAANTIRSYMKAVEQYCSMYETCDAKSLDSYKQYLVKHHNLPTSSDTRASRPHKSTCEGRSLNRNTLSTR